MTAAGASDRQPAEKAADVLAEIDRLEGALEDVRAALAMARRNAPEGD